MINFLYLNERKPEVICFGKFHPSINSSDTPSHSAHYCHAAVIKKQTNLGMIFDKFFFKMDQQIRTASIIYFYQIRVTAKVKPYLLQNDLEKVIDIFNHFPPALL